MRLIYVSILLFILIPIHSFAYSDREVVEVAKTIAAEAVGKGYWGMYLVANTIENRAKKLHISPYDVVKQRGQYYGFTAKHRNIRYKESKGLAYLLALEIAELQDKTNGAVFFRTKDEEVFPWCKQLTIVYNGLYFYK